MYQIRIPLKLLSFFVLLAILVVPLISYAQTGGSSSGQNQSQGASQQGAGQQSSQQGQSQSDPSSGGIEISTVAYDAIDNIGAYIASEILRPRGVISSEAVRAKKSEDKALHENILILDDTSYGSFMAYVVFRAQLKAITDGFDQIQAPQPAPQAPTEQNNLGLQNSLVLPNHYDYESPTLLSGNVGGTSGGGGGGTSAPKWEGYLSTLSVVASDNNVTSQSIQPQAVALSTSIARNLNNFKGSVELDSCGEDGEIDRSYDTLCKGFGSDGKSDYAKIAVIVPTYPGLTVGAVLNDLSKVLGDAFSAQAKAFNNCCSGDTATKSSTNSQYYQALSSALASLVSALQPSGSGASIVAGAWINGELNCNGIQKDITQKLDTSCGKLHILRVAFDAAGGSSRQYKPFLLSLFYTPSTTYSGGAVVTYTLTNIEGGFEDGATVRYLHDFSRMHHIWGITFGEHNAPPNLRIEKWNTTYPSPSSTSSSNFP